MRRVHDFAFGMRQQRQRATLVLLCGAVLTACSGPRGADATHDAMRDTGKPRDAMPGMNPPRNNPPGTAAGTDGFALLSPAVVKQFGITFGIADRREMRGSLRTVGTVAVDETGIVAVTTKVGGYIERLDAKVTGQLVRRGQSLAAIYSPEVLLAEEELLVAQRLGAGAASPDDGGVTLLSAARRRLRLLDVSDAQINEILRTQRAQRTTAILSPATGVLTRRDVSQGQAVQPGMPLFMISDLSRLWIDVRIPAASGAAVHDGMLASYTVTGVPGRSFTGRVSYIYPTVGDQSRTLSARVLVRNNDGALKPGMFANVEIASPGRTVLTVPRSAVIETGARSLVFVDMGDGRLIPRTVAVGATTSEMAEILSGLEAGQRVVTSAQFLLESESNLAEVMRSMIGMGAAGAKDAGMAMPGMAMPARDAPPVKTVPPARP